MPEKVKTSDFFLKHNPNDLGGPEQQINMAGSQFTSMYDFSIGDFNVGGIGDFLQVFGDRLTNIEIPEFPPFPEFGDIFNVTLDIDDPAAQGGFTAGHATPGEVYQWNGSNWTFIGALMPSLSSVLPDWFDVHEEDDGDTHVIEIDEVLPANDLVLRLHGLPTADPGSDGVWLSAT